MTIQWIPVNDGKPAHTCLVLVKVSEPEIGLVWEWALYKPGIGFELQAGRKGNVHEWAYPNQALK